MGKNSVFFINWAKIKASNKEGRILRAASEHTMKGIDYLMNLLLTLKKETSENNFC